MLRRRFPASSGDVGVWLVTLLVLIISCGQIVGQEDPAPAVKVLCWMLALVVVGSFLHLHTALVRRRIQLRATAIGWFQILAGLVVVFLGSAWTLLALPLTTVLLLISGPRGFLVAALVGAIDVGAMLARRDGTAGQVVLIICITVAVIAFALYSMTRLRVVLEELRRTREQIARVRVDEERLRISRDLHDLLGRTLVSASLRNEAALRLLDTDLERCRTQLIALRGAIIDGQARLRALTSGPTLIGLADELVSARELFDRLGLRAEVDAVGVDDPVVDQALAAVVREAVTNALKHGQPTWCRIGVRHESLAIVVSVVNDGVSIPGQGRSTGTGLDDIRARVESLGGILTAGTVPNNQFRVIARVPHVSAEPDVPPEGGAQPVVSTGPEAKDQ